MTPKPSLDLDDQCLSRSSEIYAEEIANYEAIEKRVGYGRMRDDRYGKGLNTITKEKLARESECSG